MNDNELDYINCKHRATRTFTDKNGKLISYGKCNKDGRSCRTTYMFGYDCYEIK